MNINTELYALETKKRFDLFFVSFELLVLHTGVNGHRITRCVSNFAIYVDSKCVFLKLHVYILLFVEIW